MAAAKNPVTTTVEDLPESRVRVTAEVAADELQLRINQAATQMGRGMRVDGFRAGKVPAAMVIQRYGREAVLDEAIRASMGRWYMDAIDASGIVPIGEPEIDLGEMPEAGQPLPFTVEIAVRPTATLGDISSLEVERREPAASDEAIDEQIEQMRQQAARLDTVERPAEKGDYAVIDFVGYTGSGDERAAFDGGEGRDHLLEIGGERFIPGFEEQLIGMAAGDEKTIEVTFPEEYPAAEHLAGQPAEFEVTLHEVKSRSLPELDDNFAADAGGFDTLAELREDIEKRLLEQDEDRVETEFREAVLDAAVEAAEVEIPESLSTARARELWEQMLQQLSQRGLTKDSYLQMSGQQEDELLAEARPDAEKALRREAVLAAIIEAEDIVPGDGEILEALTPSAVQQGVKPEKLRKQLERNGRIDDLRQDLAQRRAIELLVERATPAAAATTD